ncbi:hypothetical protein DBR40_05435 [Pedobacter sp. KBW01]|uniref:VRR-NUC domain-containing protein n=1 Tax=Pedobacter sp. KBW01 TaxID=2153364 RepID=UPI000F590B54|nr:VRR-NUC domain-containing protein [Pedobacter sp. KBW01]RQO79162.1 hypothetical protein DBR40_05435 [Pedobacter sp. KBW01]
MASGFQNRIKREYEKKGYKVIKLAKTNANGITDLMCLKDGKSIFIESKEANDSLKELQKYRIDELKALGFDAFCLQDGKGRVYG